MRLADSVRERNPEDGTIDTTEGGLLFCPFDEAFNSFLGGTAGKLLLLSDGERFPLLSPFTRSPRALSMILGSADALPLFAMPEEVGGIVAAGGSEVMEAARLFAAVRRVPCLLAPSDCTLGGVFTERGGVLLGERCALPLARAAVCMDESLLISTAAEGFARVLLARLAFFEGRARSVFFGVPPPPEYVYARLRTLPSEVGEIASLNAFLAAEGFTGEGDILAERTGRFAAFEVLQRLYTAFFRCGRPRKYAVADYAARAEEADCPPPMPPTEETYAKRALLLERTRATFLRELRLITKDAAAYRRQYISLGGRVEKADLREVRLLPERSGGLSVLMRDFGLLEEL